MYIAFMIIGMFFLSWSISFGIVPIIKRHYLLAHPYEKVSAKINTLSESRKFDKQTGQAWTYYDVNVSYEVQGKVHNKQTTYIEGAHYKKMKETGINIIYVNPKKTECFFEEKIYEHQIKRSMILEHWIIIILIWGIYLWILLAYMKR